MNNPMFPIDQPVADIGTTPLEWSGPVLAGGPVVFLCCDPCASHLCVRPDCDHGELDEKTFANAADALDLLHEGCLCFVMPKGEHDKKTD